MLPSLFIMTSFRYAINPARDLGPRVMTWMFGWGNGVWTESSYWFWIPVVMCHIGGIIGAVLHLVTMEWSWCGHDNVPGDEEDKEQEALKMDNV